MSPTMNHTLALLFPTDELFAQYCANAAVALTTNWVAGEANGLPLEAALEACRLQAVHHAERPLP